MQVFKSYGWTLPFIIISWLVATGPKAFLMALALPLGQSAITLAFEKIWGRTPSRQKRRSRSRMRRKTSINNVSDVQSEDVEEEEGQETRKRRTGYQSWVVGNGGSVDNSGQEAGNFGGWDDLERLKYAQRPSRMTGGSGRRTTEKGKLSRRERKSETPLLLRLLIAVFPFLGSWTKMLW